MWLTKTKFPAHFQFSWVDEKCSDFLMAFGKKEKKRKNLISLPTFLFYPHKPEQRTDIQYYMLFTFTFNAPTHKLINYSIKKQLFHFVFVWPNNLCKIVLDDDHIYCVDCEASSLWGCVALCWTGMHLSWGILHCITPTRFMELLRGHHLNKFCTERKKASIFQ